MQKNLLQRATALLTAAALTTTAAFAQAPTFEWGKSFGSTSYESANSITTDMAGNSYLVGQFGGTVDFNPSADTFALDATNGNQFLAKFAANGDFIWAKQSSVGYTIKYANGSLYAFGSFTGTTDIDFGTGVTNITSVGSNDIFMTKMDTAANLIWSKTIGNTNSDNFQLVELNPNGSFYIANRFTGTLDTDPSTGVNTITSTNSALYISSFDSNGDLEWTQAYPENLYVTALSYAHNNLYATFFMDVNSLVFPGGQTLTQQGTVADMILAKINTTNGAISWVKNFADIDIDIPAFINIKSDETTVYFTNVMDGNVDYDPSAAVFNLSHFQGRTGVWATFDHNGNFITANQFEKTSNAADSRIEGLDTDYLGNAYLTGTTIGIIDFDPSATTNNSPTSVNNTTFITKLTANNALDWFEVADSGLIYSSAIHVDNIGNIYVAGNFQNTCDLDFTAGTSYATSAGSNDAFVFKLDQPTFVSVSRQAENATPIRLFPNPAANFINIENAPIGSQLRIVDALGRTALSQIISSEYSQIATDALSNGVYFFQFHINGEATATQKIIIAK